MDDWLMQREASGQPALDSESESDGGDDGQDRPPAHFHQLARSFLPSVSPRTIMQAWDRSRGIGGGGNDNEEYDPEGPRVQAAINFIFELHPPTPPRQAPAPPPAPPATPLAPPARFGDPALERAAFEPQLPQLQNAPPPPAPHPAPKRPFVIDLDDNDDDDDFASIAGPAPKGKGKGKGKEKVYPHPHRPFRQDVIDLTSDDDDDEPRVVNIPAAPAKIDKGKGKARASSLSPPLDVMGAQADYASLEQSATDARIASIVAIFPDVLPSYALGLLQAAEIQAVQTPTLGSGVIESVVEHLFSEEGKYPKVENGKGKGKKRERSVEPVEKGEEERDWLDVKGRERLGTAYEEASLNALYSTYDRVSKAIIRKTYASAGSFFAPAFIALNEAMEQDPVKRGFTLLQNGRVQPKGKGKEVPCIELEKERAWALKTFRKAEEEKAAAERLIKEAEDEVARGEFFECGCCFGDVGFSLLVTCTEGCQFCRECALNNANNQVGSRKYTLPCMNTDGCKAFFPESEAIKFLPATTVAALHKIKQEKEVDLAEIEGLKKCPFCSFAYVIENPAEKLFVCQRDDCGITSCLECKKEDHLPKSCAEMDLDKKIDGIHKVEEAMSEALIRRCPKCSEPYVKEDGCNKITCPSCRTLSCYICGKIVKGYEHFKNAGSNATYTEPGASCLLWDDSNLRNFEEVEAARKVHAALVAKENPAIVEEDLKGLDLPAPPPVAGPTPHYALAPYPYYPGGPVPRLPVAHHHRIVVPQDPVQLALAQVRAAADYQVAMQAQERMKEHQLRLQAERAERERAEAERRRVAQQRANVALQEERRRRREADDAKAAKRDRLRRK